ncbi:ribonuclease HII [Bacillus spongiae]|uniref:Ribonuclease HII n=1 Tax=Bacillus spongiae TaxID=2683610 RepID=A0ABU8HA08_9BACI
MATIKEIKEQLQNITEINHPQLKMFELDKRVGVQKLVKQWHRENEKRQQLVESFEKMSIYENKMRKEGFQFIAGVDEVGRGPLAGPVVASAVILPESCYIPGLNDSKKLSEAKREELYEQIQQQAVAVGVGILTASEIDQWNIYEATKKAMLQGIQQLNVKPDFLLVDAMKLDLPIEQLSIIKGDATSISIAAASIVAKVTRDRLMKQYAKKYPQYGFQRNMGYGTSEHIEALQAEGPCELHRKTFAPIKTFFQ